MRTTVRITLPLYSIAPGWETDPLFPHIARRHSLESPPVHLNRDRMLLDDFGTTGYAQEDDGAFTIPSSFLLFFDKIVRGLNRSEHREGL